MSNTKRRALFSEGNIPPGGTCLSSFVVASSGSKILVGKIGKPEAWVERFFVSQETANKAAGSGKFVLPARHLAWYESPLDAAESILREQATVTVPRNKIRLVGVQSHLRGDPSSTDKPPHWDICFVYGVSIPAERARKLKAPEWFEALGFEPRSRLSPDDFARGHGDILEEAGLIGKTKKKA